MLVESGILGFGILTIAIFGIQVPLPKIRDLVLGIRYPRRRTQNPKLSCIPLHGGWGGGEGGRDILASL